MVKNTYFLRKIKSKNLITKMIVVNLIIYICMTIFIPHNTLAVQAKYPYVQGSLVSYPGYEKLIRELKNKHPNWNFTILNTGLDWNDVIKNETVASHGRNLIWYTNSGSWVCSTCGDKLYDSGKWKCASETAVAYYMDPRNWLNEENIFQFENLAYNGDIQNIDGVNKIVSTIPWANVGSINYTKPDGTIGVIQKSYSQVIMEAARDAGISPYHLAARIKQEQGTGVTASATGSGTYGGHIGYYNFLNIKATGNDIIGNALNYAQNQGWDDPEKAIRGGAVFLASSYISKGQSTLYLQKFDVDSSDGSLYYHQYMQNVSAALSEGNTVKKSYESMGFLDSNINFVIPVYNNMPGEGSYDEGSSSIVTQNVKVTGDDVIVRNGQGTSSAEITRLKLGTILLRIETSGTEVDGHYWDKIVLEDGSKGYIARDYLEQIADVTNANISAVANVNVNVRNGPGTNGTSVIRTLTSGQSVTIIETGKYNGLDGYNWSRVKLSNGAQGYMVSEYLTEVNKTNYQMAYVECNSDGKVYVRSGIGTGYSIVTALGKDTKVTVLQKNAGQANGFNWDKIVTLEGLEGYMANTYLRYEDNNNGDNNNTSDVKKGDANGDGVINSGDLLAIQKHLLGVKIITDPARINAADANGDGVINSGDLLKIQKYLLGVSSL